MITSLRSDHFCKGENMKVKIIDLQSKENIVVLHTQDKGYPDESSGYVKLHSAQTNTSAKALISSTLVQPGEIGIPRRFAEWLKVKDGSVINVQARTQNPAYRAIRKKFHGEKWTEEDIRLIFSEIYHGNLTELEMATFALAQQFTTLSTEEIQSMCVEMSAQGDKIDFQETVYDKHSIGGVPGNKVSLLVVPIIASAGLLIPKTSSRAITSPSGTADTMEVLANVSFSPEEILEIAPKTRGMIVWGGTMNLVPVDNILIDHIERPLNVDPPSVIIASILGKKLSLGVKHMVLDMPMGEGTKIETQAEALNLAHTFIDVGRRLGIKIEAAITYGDQPIGRAIGPSLEAKEALLTLMGKGSRSVKEKSIELSGILFEMAGLARKGLGRDLAEEYVNSGKALAKFKEIIEAQGGNPNIKPEEIPLGKYTHDVTIENEGYLTRISNKAIAKIARALGCPSKKTSGIYLHKKQGEFVSKGDVVMTFYADREADIDDAIQVMKRLDPLRLEGMVLERVSLA